MEPLVLPPRGDDLSSGKWCQLYFGIGSFTPRAVPPLFWAQSAVEIARNGEPKSGSRAIVSLSPQAALMGLYDRAADGEPYAHAAFFGCVERFEKQVRRSWVKADS